MASQFQNRIVGAVVLVALGVIILPSLLDGDKKHYTSDFAAIPVIPTAENSRIVNELPPATDPLPDPVIVEPSTNDASSELTNQANETTVTENNGQTPASKPVENSPPPAERTPVSPPSERNDRNDVPKGKAYVIQLAALTNAAKVEEIKATLSFANYTVFTIPVTAVQGKTTRIFIGPDASRQKLEQALPALEKLTGLKGVVKEHKVTN
jgi:DedD protein